MPYRPHLHAIYRGTYYWQMTSTLSEIAATLIIWEAVNVVFDVYSSHVGLHPLERYCSSKVDSHWTLPTDPPNPPSAYWTVSKRLTSTSK